MTRFARAKGSKASNEKLPEPPTPWAEMKQELLNKNEELAENQKREEALKRRQANYQAFLEEKEAEEDRQISWASFPEENKTVNNKGKSPVKRKFGVSGGDDDDGVNGKRLKKDLTQTEEDGFSDSSDEQFSALKSQIDEVLAKQNQNGDVSDDDDNDPPDEVGVKEKPEEIVVKKAKKPKQKLKIILDSKQLSKPSQVDEEGNRTEDVHPKQKFKVHTNDNLTEKEKKLIQKKHDRYQKQLEKKKLKKKNQQTEQGANITAETKIENKEPNSLDDSKLQKKLERRKKQREKKKMKKLHSDGTVSVKQQENLGEEDLKKIQRKKEKAAKQAEKRKKFKQVQETTKTIETEEPHTENVNEYNNCINNNVESIPNTPFKGKSNSDSKGNKPFQNHPATPKQKKVKTRDNKEHPSRKLRPEKMFINGKTIEIDYIEGFPVKKEDAERLKKLRKEMISKGLPRSEINAALKIERRRAEKALAREKKNVCFNCRKSGHNLSECPELDKDQVAQTAGTGICFKCGSTEHTHFECKVVKGQEYKFASCFICKEQGHIARQCPDNQRGLYPKGGSCKVCGDVTHLKKDCPKYQAQQAQLQNSLCIETISSGNPDDIATKGPSTSFSVNDKKLNKIIKF